MDDGVLLVQVLVDGNEGLLVVKPDLALKLSALILVLQHQPCFARNELPVRKRKAIPMPEEVFPTLELEGFPALPELL